MPRRSAQWWPRDLIVNEGGQRCRQLEAESTKNADRPAGVLDPYLQKSPFGEVHYRLEARLNQPARAGDISFRCKDYAHGSKKRKMTLLQTLTIRIQS